MNSKRNLILLAVALILVLGGAVLLYSRLSAGANLSGVGGAPSGSQGDGSAAQTVAAPSFPMATPEGEEIALSDLLGDKPVVLNFWASTCPPCKAEMADFQTAYEAYGDQIHFVMVNVGDAMQGETREKADAYLEESGFTFPVYFDLDYQGITAYGVTGFPHTYFVDGAGNLQLYAPGMISAAGLQQGLHAIAPELVPAPSDA